MAPYIRTFFPREANAATLDSRAVRFAMYPREMGTDLGSDIGSDNHSKTIDKPGMKCEIYAWMRHDFRSYVVEERIVGT
jgi:hypothetical protein